MEVQDRSKRKINKGRVISNKMQNTVIVEVEWLMRHPRYSKVIKRRRKLYAHHEAPLQIGDMVTVMETRPLSKLKRWRVIPE